MLDNTVVIVVWVVMLNLSEDDDIKGLELVGALWREDYNNNMVLEHSLMEHVWLM